MVIIIKVIVAMIVAVIMAVIIMAAMVIIPGKGSGKNPEKFSLRKKGRFPSGFLTQNEARIGVINIPINISPT